MSDEDEIDRLTDELAIERASVAEQRGTIEQLISLNAQLRVRLGDQADDDNEYPPALTVSLGYWRTATFTPRRTK